MSVKRDRYKIRPIQEAFGCYVSNLRVFLRRARECLTRLETISTEARAKWPGSLDQAITEAKKNYPDLEALCFQRDLLSDSVLIFAAMAVEAFLNYYGVVRMGEAEFARNFERLGVAAKLRSLLLFCDSIRITDDDPLLAAVNKLTQNRNALVHPKTKEVRNNVESLRDGPLIPEAAQEAVAAMGNFFKGFEAIVPEAKHLIPHFQDPKN
jgi:hypothetical protein